MLDLRDFDVTSDKCWRKLRLLLDGLERDNRLRWFELVHSHNAAVLSVHNVSTESFESANKGTMANLAEVEKHLFPYIKRRQVEVADINTYRQAYKERFGDWQNDPVAKANLDRLVAFLQQRADEGARMLARKSAGNARSAK